MMTILDKRIKFILLIVAFLLLIPLIAMQFTDEVNWGIFDFLVAGILLGGTGIGLELILRKIKTRRNRIVLIVTLCLTMLLIWVELAVGIFGTPIGGH